ncbi:MAG TPA: phosphoribosylanthranilate isomerase [Kofleriaceae bacterium]|jgi:phosphoribosylanthranilate isomerase|nr:phosphoribosylanthranilate isomerase [Kofleriaceae bacterium]
MTRPTTKIKICGFTQPDDAAQAAAAGVDYIGLNFWPRSKRYLPAERAPAIAAAARAAGAAQLVGVFVNHSLAEIAAIARAVPLDLIQLHGDESPADVAAITGATRLAVWKAIAVAEPRDLDGLDAWPVEAILLDAPAVGRGGGGKVFDWALARTAQQAHPTRRLVLAGGLGPHNVAAAIDAVDPWAVDVASGVESAPGIKDAVQVTAFITNVRHRLHR